MRNKKASHEAFFVMDYFITVAPLHNVVEQRRKLMTIFIAVIDVFLRIPARRHMIERTGNFNT